MKKFRYVLALLISSSLLAAAPAMADVIDFNLQQADVFDGGAVLHEAGYVLDVLEGPVTAALGLHGTSGAILDPSDPFSCELVACPVGDASRYYAGLGDGGLHLGRSDGLAFTLNGLDYGFVASLPLANGIYGQLVLSGTRVGGGAISVALDFPGQDGDGNFVFSSATLGAFSGVQLSGLNISACVFTDSGSCVNSLEDMAYGQAQFALDNISVSAVPEPSTWLLLLAGLAGLALVGRRRRSAALALSALLLGTVPLAQASTIAIVTGDTTGAPTFLRPMQYGGPDESDYMGYTAYRLFDVNILQNTAGILFDLSCGFDCSMFLYKSFDPAAPLENFISGDDNYVAPQTAGLGGPLRAGHYSLVVTGDSWRDSGYFSLSVVGLKPFTITAVPEPSTWLMLLGGLLAVGLAARRHGRRALVLALLAGAMQQASADVVTVSGDTTFGPTFHRPSNYGGEPNSLGQDVAYRAYNVSVTADGGEFSFLTVCGYNCGTFLYEGSFDPADSHRNILDGRALGGTDDMGESAISVYLRRGQQYVLVVTGYGDYDWGEYFTTVAGPGGISISAVPEPSTSLMLLGGLIAIGVAARRRNKDVTKPA